MLFFPNSRIRFSTLLPVVFRYFPARRALPFGFDQRALGPFAFGNRVQKHRFTEAAPRTSWRPPKMACGESAGVVFILRVQQTPGKHWFLVYRSFARGKLLRLALRCTHGFAVASIDVKV